VGVFAIDPAPLAGGGAAELALAHAVGDALERRGHAAVLTRACQLDPAGDDARLAIARGARPDAFVGLALGGADALWIHEAAREPSRALARALAQALRGAGRPEPPTAPRRLRLLEPARHAGPACLAVFGRGPLAIADSLAARLDEWLESGRTVEIDRRFKRGFDVWHEVPLVPQITGMSCWAAAAAMVVGWRDCVDVDPEEVARASGRWREFRDGLEPSDVETLARTWRLHIERLPAAAFGPERLIPMLEENGPLWLGEASPGLHVVVVAGAHGDGSAQGTWFRIADPWPVGRGERYSLTLAQLAQSTRTAAELAGQEIVILHAGGRGAGACRSSWRMRESVSLRA
jgi:hypothetical protein